MFIEDTLNGHLATKHFISYISLLNWNSKKVLVLASNKSLTHYRTNLKNGQRSKKCL